MDFFGAASTGEHPAVKISGDVGGTRDTLEVAVNTSVADSADFSGVGRYHFDGNVIGHIAINAQTGTTYTLVLADDGKMVTCSNAGAITVTVPTNASVAYPTGTQILIVQKGAGQVTIEGDSGVTVSSLGGEDTTIDQYSPVSYTHLRAHET